MKRITLIAVACVLASASTFAQESAPSSQGMAALKLPSGATFLAKLSTNLTLGQCKPGDAVEAEATQDVKKDKQVLLKKGSALLGHVTAVQLATAEKSENVVGIVFDTISMHKTKQNFSLHLIVQAVAPEANLDTSNSIGAGNGSGIDTATRHTSALQTGRASTVSGNVNPLSANSTGIYDLSGITLSDQVSSTGRITILASSNSNFRLKKGMQLVMRAVEQ